MAQATGAFTMGTLERKRVEKFRRREKDVRIHHRLSAVLWLANGRTAAEVAALLDVSSHTVTNWMALYRTEGLEALCSLGYKGDPG